MKYLFLLSFLLLTPTVYADDLSEDDEKVIEQHGYSKKEIKKLVKERRKKINTDSINDEIAKSFEVGGFDQAKYVDKALDNLIKNAVTVLIAYGYEKEADEIDQEYKLNYQNYYFRVLLSGKELGDFPPMSPWLTKVHEKIEELIGEFLCKWFHFHSIWILNYGLPIVFQPSSYDLENYVDASAGHKWGWFWIHHGVYGTVSYFVVNGICAGATAGMGIITFICGPISGFAESAMDSYIAPPVSEAIWKRFNQ